MNGSKDEGSALEFDSIADCVADFAAGNFLIVLDSPSRENEGDLIISARHLTPAKCGFMIRHTSGYLCCPMPASRAKLLDLKPMVPLAANEDPMRTAYTITLDAVHEDVTTGISAHDRSITANMLADASVTQAQFRRPGHVIPLIAKDGGVRVRMGHTEAALDLCRLAGVQPEVSVIGEMVVDGEVPEANGAGASSRKIPEYHGAGMMRAPECLEFGKTWGIKCCTIMDLKAYVEANQKIGQPNGI